MDGNSTPLEDMPRSNTSSSLPKRQTFNANENGDNGFAKENSKEMSDPEHLVSEEERQKRIVKEAMSVQTPPKKECNRNILTTISFTVIHSIEKAFISHGRFVGTYPHRTIFVSILMCLICGLLVETLRPGDLNNEDWVPVNARVIDEKDWVENTFESDAPFVSFLIEDTNVLTPAILQGMQEYYKQSLTFSANGKRFSQLCVRTGSHCSVISLLELWDYDSNVIDALTTDDIITKLNTTERTPRSDRHIGTLLGGTIRRDASGVVVSAQATQMTWELTKEDEPTAEDFEGLMIDYGLRGHSDIGTTYVFASRSDNDEVNKGIDEDALRLVFGFVMVFVYILLALGKFNLMEQKIHLSMTGLNCVALSIVVAYGIGSGLGLTNSALQNLLPFLLLGIGVDDMFVIVEAWKNLSPEENELAIPDKISACLAHAGMSVTVTSLTDIMAFAIGATTVIPALRSFCIFAAIGIFALFCLVLTLFVAVLALDERRRRERRDACIVCYRHPENYHPNKWSTGRTFLQRVFNDYYGPFILKKPVKGIIIILSLVMASIGMWRFTLIEQDYDPINWIPSDSYAYRYSRAKEDLFNSQGIPTRVYCANFDYSAYRTNLNSMYDRMANSPYIQEGSINSWFTAYHNYLDTNAIVVSSEDEYYHELFSYLQGAGEIYNSFIVWNATTEPVKILGSSISAIHVREDNAQDSVDSMDALREIIDTSGFPRFSGSDLPEYKCFAYAPDYQALETNKVTGEELMRNMILAGVTVLIITLILIADFRASFMVFICVFFTMADLGGMLELWGSVIDNASTSLLVLAVGLAIDYSAHIGRTFMTVEGTKDERALSTLRDIGPAVLNGGISTVLAFIILAESTSYGFELFFRVFLLVVLFGLFHGLCLLPVILSLLGPPSYKEAQKKSSENAFPTTSVSTGSYHSRQAWGNRDKNGTGNRSSRSELQAANGDQPSHV